jgi:hypothetical protein
MRPRLATAFVVAAYAAVATAYVQTAPSQRELNGFLLGQHASVLANAFGDPYKEISTEDGWVYRVYTLDRSRGAYMVFKFPSFRPDYVYSIQLAGQPGTEMHSFVGMKLGDDSSAVLERLGPPSRIEYNPEFSLSLWSYDDRNYSVEIDSLGRLYSIQIFGYAGFPEYPEGPLAPVEPLRQALSARDVDELLDVLAADFEIFKGDSVYRFERAARRDLSDRTSVLSRLLYAAPGSLREILADVDLEKDTEVALRLYDRQRPGTIYSVCKFAEGLPITEIVFQGHAGRWRVWEIHYR